MAAAIAAKGCSYCQTIGLFSLSHLCLVFPISQTQEKPGPGCVDDMGQREVSVVGALWRELRNTSEMANVIGLPV